MKQCSCGMLKKILEANQRNKLMQLLVGLNKSYDPVKTNMLNSDVLPPAKAYYMLQQVETQKKLNDVVDLLPEISALTVSRSVSKR